MPYTQTTFGDLTTAFANRLSDPLYQFWSKPEMQSYLIEAMRTWQIFGAGYNTRVNTTTVANQWANDLFLLPELAPSVQDIEIVRDIAFALQEPYDLSTSTWIGTSQFSIDQIYNSIKQRRDRFFLETGLCLARAMVNGPLSEVSRMDLPEDVIDIRQALWYDIENPGTQYSLIWRDDGRTMQYVPAMTAAMPTEYVVYPLTPITLEFFPTPPNQGQLDFLYVKSMGNLVQGTPQILGIPDDLCWVIKFGVLADLFGSDGPGRDAGRADYCESRWNDGIQLARITSFVHLGYSTGNPSLIDTLEELNTGRPNWMVSTGPPETLAIAGNMLITNPIPDGIYGLSFDILPKFPVPVVDADTVQLGPEVLESLLDYAQHIASVKEGTSELTDLQRAYKNFVQVAMVQNERLRSVAQNFDIMNTRDNTHNKEFLRRTSDINLKELDYVK